MTKGIKRKMNSERGPTTKKVGDPGEDSSPAPLQWSGWLQVYEQDMSARHLKKGFLHTSLYSRCNKMLPKVPGQLFMMRRFFPSAANWMSFWINYSKCLHEGQVRVARNPRDPLVFVAYEGKDWMHTSTPMQTLGAFSNPLVSQLRTQNSQTQGTIKFCHKNVHRF